MFASAGSVGKAEVEKRRTQEETKPGTAYPEELEAQLSGISTGPLVVEDSADPTESRGMADLLQADLSKERRGEHTLAWLRQVARSGDDPTDPVSFRILDNPSVAGESDLGPDFSD